MRVRASGKLREMVGHPKDFELEDMEILRDAARELKAREKWSDERLGTELGIAQQNAQRFVGKNATGGISRKTANRLAIACRFRDAEELVMEGRAMKGLRSGGKGNVWHARDSAVRMAEAVGYSREAIDAVMERCNKPEFGRETVKWWLSQFVLEELQHAAGGRRA